jgi:hypothetical protein
MLSDILVGGIPTPLKNMKVSWDDDIPNIWNNNPNVPNHQPDHHQIPIVVGLYRLTSINHF